jgi:hypothetical protein
MQGYGAPVRLFLPARVAFAALTQERCDRPSGLSDPTRCHLMCGRVYRRPHRPDSGSGCFVYPVLRAPDIVDLRAAVAVV